MRKKADYILITFDTTAQAVAMESYCQSHGIPGRLIPVPSAVSAGCGICWRIKPEEFRAHEALLRSMAYGQLAEARL